MERHERYDPEDIESLLSERGFDELLEAERAFVLRHLSGREEYERMRALLHYVRPDERSRPRIEADERIRRNVLEVFRAQQRPQWRIWLNSLASWSMPRGSAGYWRPALAFGTLALLIGTGVLLVRQFSDGTGHAGLAEVKQIAPGPKDATAPAAAKEEVEKTQVPGSPEQTLPQDVPPSMAAVAEAHSEQEKEAALETQGAMDHAEEAPAILGSEAGKISADLADGSRVNEEDAILAPVSTSTSSEQPATGHVVTSDELARNMSYANVSEVSKVTTSRKRSGTAERMKATNTTGSRNMAQDPELLGLLSTGW